MNLSMILFIDVGTGEQDEDLDAVCFRPPNIWVIVQHRPRSRCNVPIKS